MELLAADLFGGAVSFTAPSEGMVVDILPLGGTLVGGRVFYDHPPEGITVALSLLSGTLT